MQSSPKAKTNVNTIVVFMTYSKVFLERGAAPIALVVERLPVYGQYVVAECRIQTPMEE